MQSDVESAKPDGRWTGAASDSYSSANDKQGRVLGQLADLDQRLRTEIDRSAQVVTAGRQNLDAVRQWVNDAAATVPPGQNRERMLYSIVSRGSGEITEILQRSNGDLNAIAGRMRGLNGDYQMLAGDLKQGTGKDGEKETQGIVGEETEEELKKRAQADVKAALDGDKDAIQRVQNVLNTISPQQQTGQPKLNPEQAAYLSQMQAQQKLRSVAQLEEAATKGARGIMADSWQLMSNPKLEFPKTDSVDGALQSSDMVKGGFNQLPDSVQSTIQSPGIQQSENLQKIVDIVNGGNANGYFQHDTDLDRGLLHKVADMMESPEWRSDDPPLDIPGRWPWEDAPRPPHAALEKVASDVFHAVHNDHQVVHDAVSGNVQPGNEFRDQFKIDKDHFMYNLTHEAWDDRGAAAGSLFDWTDDSATGPEARIAGETARSVSEFLGNSPDLLSLNGDSTVGLYGTHSLGEVNPVLVQGFSEGLSPYVNNIAGTQGGLPSFGGMLDDPGPVQDGILPEAKNVFSVLNTDPEAAKVFNGAALGQALLHDTAYAQHPDPTGKPSGLYDSATLRALVDVGMTNNIDTEGKNQAQIDAELYGAKSAAFDYGLDGLTKAGSVAIPGVGGQISGEALSHLGPAVKDSIIGPPPPGPDQPEPIGRFASERADAEMLNSLNSVGAEIKNLPPEYRGDGGRILSYEEMYARDNTLTPGEYASKVDNAINTTLGFDFQDEYIKSRYDQITADRHPPIKK
jgi:EspA/EspE family